jgi:hypothetical protein
MSTKSVTSIESETNTKAATVLPMPPLPQAVSKLIQQYGCGPVQFFGTDSALYERHLIFNNVVDLTACDARIRPLQDLLNLESHARMNMPGQAHNNWCWRFTEDILPEHGFHWLGELTITTHRSAALETLERALVMKAES